MVLVDDLLRNCRFRFGAFEKELARKFLGEIITCPSQMLLVVPTQGYVNVLGIECT